MLQQQPQQQQPAVYAQQLNQQVQPVNLLQQQQQVSLLQQSHHLNQQVQQQQPVVYLNQQVHEQRQQVHAYHQPAVMQVHANQLPQLQYQQQYVSIPLQQTAYLISTPQPVLGLQYHQDLNVYPQSGNQPPQYQPPQLMYPPTFPSQVGSQRHNVRLATHIANVALRASRQSQLETEQMLARVDWRNRQNALQNPPSSQHSSTNSYNEFYGDNENF